MRADFIAEAQCLPDPREGKRSGEGPCLSHIGRNRDDPDLMRFIGLAADLVPGRILASDRPLRVPGRAGSVAGGALGFGSVSVLVFACWAYAGR